MTGFHVAIEFDVIDIRTTSPELGGLRDDVLRQGLTALVLTRLGHMNGGPLADIASGPISVSVEEIA